MWTMNQSCNEHGQLTNKEIILKIMGSVNGQYSANNRDTVFGIPIKTALDFPNQWWWSAHYFCNINCASIYGLIRIFSTFTEIIYKDNSYTLEQDRDSDTIRKSSRYNPEDKSQQSWRFSQLHFFFSVLSLLLWCQIAGKYSDEFLELM